MTAVKQRKKKALDEEEGEDVEEDEEDEDEEDEEEEEDEKEEKGERVDGEKDGKSKNSKAKTTLNKESEPVNENMKNEMEIRAKIKELRDNLPIRELGARKRPEKPTYTSITHAFRALYGKKYDLKEFKKKYGEIKVLEKDAKKKKKIIHPYMRQPEYIEANRVYDEMMLQNKLKREEYKNNFPNAYQHWIEMRKITKLENLLNPVIQEERRKKQQAKRAQAEKDEDSDILNKRAKILKYIPDDVSRELVIAERNLTRIALETQEKIAALGVDMQKTMTLCLQESYDKIVKYYKTGLLTE